MLSVGLSPSSVASVVSGLSSSMMVPLALMVPGVTSLVVLMLKTRSSDFS